MCSTSLRTNHHIHFSIKLMVLQVNLHAGVVGKMANHRKRRLKKILGCRKAIALPVTFMMLFVSLLILITATYYFSITRITAKTLALKTSGVEQEMLSLEKTIKFVSWSPGAYEIHEFGDFGGTFKVSPTANPLILNLTDNSSFYDVFYSSPVGKALYELASTEDVVEDMFLKGDNRAVVNQSSSTMTQLYTAQGAERYELTLSYRPLASITVTSSDGGQPVNSLRVYVISLNASESVAKMGTFRLKTGCLDVASTLRTYNFTSPLAQLTVRANLASVVNEVSLPISSNAQGAIVNLETIVCTVRIEDVGW
jgi:hypothetical protein